MKISYIITITISIAVKLCESEIKKFIIFTILYIRLFSAKGMKI